MRDGKQREVTVDDKGDGAPHARKGVNEKVLLGCRGTRKVVKVSNPLIHNVYGLG